jgi:hypothetical protein
MALIFRFAPCALRPALTFRGPADARKSEVWKANQLKFNLSTYQHINTSPYPQITRGVAPTALLSVIDTSFYHIIAPMALIFRFAPCALRPALTFRGPADARKSEVWKANQLKFNLSTYQHINTSPYPQITRGVAPTALLSVIDTSFYHIIAPMALIFRFAPCALRPALTFRGPADARKSEVWKANQLKFNLSTHQHITTSTNHPRCRAYGANPIPEQNACWY